jgi:two-component system, NtrC family, response regulator GlrR
MAGATWTLVRSGAQLTTPAIEVEVLDGPDKGARASAPDGRMTLGTAETSAIRLTDGAVSRFHLELEATDAGVRARDLGSTNGTRLGSTRIVEAVLTQATELVLGRTRVRVSVSGMTSGAALLDAPSFYGLSGVSPAMRAVMKKLEVAAQAGSTVLLSGESGTGKELAAQAVHQAGPRRDGPFEVVDCGGLPATLIESELFGHVRGAFTGALGDREGAFARASGGTLFLDELGELPLEVQPKLLRALGERSVRPVGGKTPKSFDVQVVAATHRDLRKQVNQGQFRLDLYYRLAVVEVRLPPLRERAEDMPVLVATLLADLARSRGLAGRVEIDDAFMEALKKHDWPGNVRELRNYLEQTLIFQEAPPLEGAATAAVAESSFQGLTSLPLRQAKALLTERFEKSYVEGLLAACQGNVAEAARRAGVDRGTLFRMLRRHERGGE